jgi:hypothetical protein
MADGRTLVELVEFSFVQEKWSIIDEGKEDDGVIIHVSCHFNIHVSCHINQVNISR